MNPENNQSSESLQARFQVLSKRQSIIKQYRETIGTPDYCGINTSINPLDNLTGVDYLANAVQVGERRHKASLVNEKISCNMELITQKISTIEQESITQKLEEIDSTFQQIQAFIDSGNFSDQEIALLKMQYKQLRSSTVSVQISKVDEPKPNVPTQVEVPQTPTLDTITYDQLSQFVAERIVLEANAKRTQYKLELPDGNPIVISGEKNTKTLTLLLFAYQEKKGINNDLVKSLCYSKEEQETIKTFGALYNLRYSLRNITTLWDIVSCKKTQSVDSESQTEFILISTPEDKQNFKNVTSPTKTPKLTAEFTPEITTIPEQIDCEPLTQDEQKILATLVLTYVTDLSKFNESTITCIQKEIIPACKNLLQKTTEESQTDIFEKQIYKIVRTQLLKKLKGYTADNINPDRIIDSQLEDNTNIIFTWLMDQNPNNQNTMFNQLVRHFDTLNSDEQYLLELKNININNQPTTQKTLPVLNRKASGSHSEKPNTNKHIDPIRSILEEILEVIPTLVDKKVNSDTASRISPILRKSIPQAIESGAIKKPIENKGRPLFGLSEIATMLYLYRNEKKLGGISKTLLTEVEVAVQFAIKEISEKSKNNRVVGNNPLRVSPLSRLWNP